MISHPRFYWGETGNVLTPPLFKLPIPSSRSLVPTGYGYVLPDQNGWSRYLHFQSAWIVVLTGLLYVIFSFFTGHLRKNLLPVAPIFRGGRSADNCQPFALRAADCGGSLVVQRAAAAELPVCDLRSFPAGHLDGPGDVSRLCFRGSGDGQFARRPAIRAHDSLLRLPVSCCSSCWSTSGWFSCRIQEPHASDDHRPHRSRRRYGAHMSESFSPQTDHNRTGSCGGCGGPGCGRGHGAEVWTGPARSRRNLRSWRNPDLCFSSAVDEALAGP